MTKADLLHLLPAYEAQLGQPIPGDGVEWESKFRTVYIDGPPDKLDELAKILRIQYHLLAYFRYYNGRSCVEIESFCWK